MPYCSNCQTNWSTSANVKYCPECGTRFPDSSGGGLLGCGCLIVIVLAVGGVFSTRQGGKPTQAPATPPTPTPVPVVDQAGKQKPPAPADVGKTGTILLRTPVAVRPGVDAWVEIDGKRAAPWPVGKTEVTLTVPAGEHAVTVRSVFQGVSRTIFSQLAAVPPDGRIVLEVVPGKS